MVAGLLQSCSNQKNTFAHRTFHNITARYNGYFYAKESIKEGVSKLEKAHKDDYLKLLPVYMLGDEQSAKNIYPEMDKAYKKSSKVIQYHSIMIRGKEYVNWIDDNFIAIGKSHYYKRDYFAAVEVFDYVVKQYKDPATKPEAMVWMIRSHNELGNYNKSQQIVDVLSTDKEFPKKLQGELAVAYADLLLKKKSYTSAKNQLLKAIPLAKNKKQRARLTYILAQLYQQRGDMDKAARYYGAVVKANPPYEMAFQAQLNQAKTMEAGTKDTRLIHARLLKMAKDAKNKEYRDQIYYTLAEISLKQGKKDEAIAYLRLSTQNSTDNIYQKSLTFLKLADLYFQKPEYELAQAYYDSTAGILPKDFPGYDQVLRKQASLTDLVANLSVIRREDSLQRVAQMGEKERSRYIRNLIAEAEKEEEQKEALTQQNQLMVQNATAAAVTQNPAAGGAWYFYNPATKGMGIAEFQRRWGQRTLEDNWRRKNKETILPAEEQEEEEGFASASSTLPGDEDWRTEAFYLKNLPLTAEAVSASNQSIEEALFNAATIYREQLSDNKQSIKAFEELTARFENGKFELPAYYNLYLLHRQENNMPRSEHFKNLILDKYPQSAYAKAIKDPQYASQSAASKEVIEDFYEETYNKYLQRDYAVVIANSAIADSQYAKSPLIPKFHFLRALSIGATQGHKAFEDALKEVIKNHPQDEVKKKAEEMLQLLNANGSTANSQPAAGGEEPSIYKLSDAAPHNMVIVVPNKSADVNTLKTAVAQFNSKFFSTEKLAVNSMFLDANNQMVTIAGLADKTKGLKYYSAIKTDAGVAAKSGDSPKLFIISQNNYPVFYQDKNTDKYLEFFNKKYLGLN